MAAAFGLPGTPSLLLGHLPHLAVGGLDAVAAGLLRQFHDELLGPDELAVRLGCDRREEEFLRHRSELTRVEPPETALDLRTEAPATAARAHVAVLGLEVYNEPRIARAAQSFHFSLAENRNHFVSPFTGTTHTLGRGE